MTQDHSETAVHEPVTTTASSPAIHDSDTARPDPIGMVDAILRSTFAQRVTHVLLEPMGPASPGQESKLLLRRGKRTIAQAVLAADVANPVAARLVLMANLDLAWPHTQTARCLVQHGERQVDMFVTARADLATDAIRVELCVLDDDVTAPGDATTTIEKDEAAALPNVVTPGTVVGAYKLFDILGSGGMGLVYRAEHTLLKKPCAIKLLHRRVYERSAEATKRFMCEARAAARIHSDAIVNVTDVALLPDGRPYLAMELLEGISLAEIVNEQGSFEPARAVAIAREIAQALVAVHAANVVHRDLSAGNVFLVAKEDADGRRVSAVKLVDFGSAEFTDPSLGLQVESEFIVGTPWYMAPEQVQGRICDERTDLYALGVVLYELLAGTVPFNGETAHDVLLQHMQVPAPKVKAPNQDLPDSLISAVARLLQKEPQHRFASASELVHALGDIEQELTGTAS